MQGLDRYLTPLALRRPEWSAASDWLGHVPFAFWLIEACRPDTLVQLGCQDGASYFAFCQAVQSTAGQTACYAVDPWRGEDSSGAYGEHFYKTLAAHHDPRYGHFSRLQRSTFDEALNGFADGSIDLLHLHGNHNYDAVLHDFQTWLPKVSARGVILLHGVNLGDSGRGASRLWRDVAARYPANFAFLHAGGLGILAPGASPPPALREFLDLTTMPEKAAEIREVYGRLGCFTVTEQELIAKDARATRRLSQLQADFDALQLRFGELANTNQNHIDQMIEWRNRALAEGCDEERAQLAALERALQESRQQLDDVLHSRSWRYAAPLRLVMNWLRRTSSSLHQDGQREAEKPSAGALPAEEPGQLEMQDAPSATTATNGEATNERPLYLRLKQELAEARRLALPPAVAVEPIEAPLSTQPLATQPLAFPHWPDPAVSIIVRPNGPKETLATCLAALSRCTGDGVPFEVIVLDVSAEAAAETPPGHFANLLFAPAPADRANGRNQGAAMARGRYLLFLDGDVEVTPGWLATLANVFATEPQVGAAGPLILGQDGLVAEAGATLNRDGSMLFIGQGGSPREPRFAARRPVDFCSAACLMVEADAFRRLNGFADELAPGGYEDADLCLRLRRMGLKTFAAPDAMVMRRTPRAEPASGALPANRQKMIETWQDDIDALNETRVIAFYRPHFYPTPDADRWGGEGFTEWHDVGALAAQGNPRLPADLGYYDLRMVEVMEAQADLARRYGISGFCYNYYWFAGKRVYEMPLDRLLATGKPDLPFCLCWTNEDWIRPTPDGRPEVLIRQTHSAEDDDAVILDLIRYFRADRYLRIDGRPLLLIKDVGKFADFPRTAERWRTICRAEGIGEIHLTMMAAPEGTAEPGRFGCDSTLASPVETALPRPVGGAADGHQPTADVWHMTKSLVVRPLPDHVEFPGVVPWRNGVTHRKGLPVRIDGASPEAFQLAVETAIRRTREHNLGDARLVFVHAWNAWADGAYLEPDRRDGHAYLDAVQGALDAWYLAAPARGS